MTINEVIEYLEQHGFIADEVKDMCIDALVQIEQYVPLGTVEELKEAREKQVAKKPIIQQRKIRDCINMVKIFDVNICPNCGITLDDRKQFKDYPCKCGQRISWEEGETSD